MAALQIAVRHRGRLVTGDALLTRLAEAWSARWDGRWHFRAGGGRFHHPDGGGEAMVYAVAPARALAFGKGHFTRTSHRF